MRVLHVVTGLGIGGAETMLLRTVAALKKRGIQADVAPLVNGGLLAENLGAMASDVLDLGVRSKLGFLGGVMNLRRTLRARSYDLVHAWMYHANVCAELAVRGQGNAPPLITSVHHSLHATSVEPLRRRIVRQLDARLSRVNARILFASRRSMAQHIATGYSEGNSTFLPSGFDLQIFKPDDSARRAARSRLRIDENEVAIGIVARFDPIKGHQTFFNAARTLDTAEPLRFILAGTGMSKENAALQKMIGNAQLSAKCIFVGPELAVQTLLPALDIGTLSSESEGLPLVIGESMACGVPCVATDVGDCGFLIGDTGLIVPPRDAEALATAWLRLIRGGCEVRREMGARARRRICESFSMDRYIGDLLGVYERAKRDAERLRRAS